MLSTEYAIQMKGFTLFRDHADKRKYYYLPKGDVRIADDGRKLNYFAYVDSSMKGTVEEKGGFLTLEVELGPSEQELTDLKNEFANLLPYAKKQALAEKRAKGEPANESDWEDEDDFSSDKEFVLAPVQFKDGDVKLMVMGKDGSTENPLSQVKIVGTVKPSLFGKQTAVFSVRLQGKDADLMYQMLTVSKKDGNAPVLEFEDDMSDEEKAKKLEEENAKKYINSQIAVVYDLTYKGIEPAHYVKITVDFKYIEDYWNHHFELDADFNMDQKDSGKGKSGQGSSQLNNANADSAKSGGTGSGGTGTGGAGQSGGTGSGGQGQSGSNPTESKTGKGSTKSQSNISIAADVDVDVMFKDLINAGAIVIQQIDFLGDNSGSPLGADDPTAIKLVKQLLSAELFDPTPLPSEDFSVLKGKETTKPEEAKDGKQGAAKDDKQGAAKAPEGGQGSDKTDAPTNPAGKQAAASGETQAETAQAETAQTETAQAETTQAAKSQTSNLRTPDVSVVKQVAAATQEALASVLQASAKKTFPRFLTVAGEDKKITLDEWLKGGFEEDDYDKYAVVDNDGYTPYYKIKIKSDRRFPAFSTAAGEDGLIHLDEWIKAGCKREDWRTYARIGEDQYKKYQEEHETKCEATPQTEKTKTTTSDVGDVIAAVGAVAGATETIASSIGKAAGQVKETVQEVKDAVQPVASAITAVSNPAAAAVSAIEWKLDARMAYSYKKRHLSESLTRTYIFNRQIAMNQVIHPSGMLSVHGTSFDVNKQVTVGRLGEGPFRHHEIVISSALDFDTYHIDEILVDINHVDSTGTVVRLSKDKPKDTVEFYSEHYRVDSEEGGGTAASFAQDDTEGKEAYKKGEMLSYKVTVIFKSLSVKGFDGADREKVLFENVQRYTSGKTIVIGPKDIECIHPIDIQTGSLDLGKKYSSAIVSLIDAESGSENLSVYNQTLTPSTSKIVLMNPDKSYKAQIQYNIDESYAQVPVTKRKFTVTTKVLKASELVINDPDAGMVRVSTTGGAATFETVRSIVIKFSQGGKEQSFMLSKAEPVYYYVTDYNPDAPEKIIVESVKVNYLDGHSEFITPDIKEFTTEYNAYKLDV